MAYQHYRSQFGDTTFTKVFVGGLAWETPTDEMRRYFEQFGEILEAVIIADKNTGRSKGYGFVTFRDPESARRACFDPNPVIGGRRANCNIASMGRPRPSTQTGRSTQGGNPHHGGAPQGATSREAVYNPQLQPPQYYHQVYGTLPYHYGYSSQALRGSFSAPQAHRIQGPSHLHYPTPWERPFTTFPPPPPPPPPPVRHFVPLASGN
ncbi:hypothetical protein HHK36_008108 [Tetracentron sinense]|uniref:RRM domain-containing protein n=1 Tax=Tetracentron sinense TaxID=13715 RepID=A0A834ZIY3_TETSI|nr:hypothetical protein HHK36_008108 [Tetracentron sinense]